LTYQQQVWKLTKLHQFECPHIAILKDIAEEMKVWQESSNHLIPLTNFNDVVTDPDIQAWAANLGLVEALTYLHPKGAPPTYQQGSRPIDGIFMEPQLLSFAARGYLSFGDAIPSNHQALWLYLHLPEICPQQLESHMKPQVCRLQCKDP